MKMKKIILIMIIATMILSSIMPTVALAVEEIPDNDKTNKAEEKIIENEEQEDIETKEENINKEEPKENETNENTNIDNKEECTEETKTTTNENETIETNTEKNSNKEEVKDVETLAENTAKIEYNSHVQDYGWEQDFSKKDGEISGTTGKEKRIEALKIKLGNLEKIPENASVEYQVHVQDYGWMNWQKDGQIAGTIGKSKRVEAIRIKLHGLDNYSVIYRTHVQNIGWTDWKSDGEISGTVGSSKRIEAIQIKILEEKYEAFSVNIKNEKNTINEYIKNNIHYLFLSKDVDIKNVNISYSGNILSTTYGKLDTINKKIVGDFSNTESFTVTLATGETKQVSVIQSDVPALFVNLSDNVTQNTLDSGSKDDKYSASLNVVGAEKNSYNISDYGITIKGRGNTTWKMAKKPYQIKFDKKINLLGTGTAKAKKWVLIANYQDPTLLKNKIENDLCVNSGLSNIPNSQFVDLYINGNYVGNYLLCDKIETGSGRIKLKDDKGVLSELDNAYYNDEEYNFQAEYSKDHFAIKEFKDDDLDASTKSSAMQEFKKSLEKFEKTIYKEDVKWEEIEKLIDVESFAKYYLVNEFAENSDTYYSSTYLYKDGANDVIHMGPTWDYDAAFGYQEFEARGRNPEVDFTLTYSTEKLYMKALFKHPEFAKIVNKIYEENVKQYITNINVKEYANSIKKSSRINSIVWYSEKEYNEKLNKLDNWINKRINYFNRTYYSSKYDSNVLYMGTVENIGWQQIQIDGQNAGTTGRNLRMEGIKIYLGDKVDSSVGIQYQAHIENIGWQEWKNEGELAGTTGRSLRMEAIRIKLTNTNDYVVQYRVHVQDKGWMSWCSNGEIAGTVGESKRIEAIQIKVIKKPNISVSCKYNENENTVKVTIKSDKKLMNINDTAWKLSDDKLTYEKEYSINDKYQVTVEDVDGMKQTVQFELTQIIEPESIIKYNSHIQNYGWEDRYSKRDGDITGTTGKAKRLEAIKISLGNSEQIPQGAKIEYQVHIQDIGWQGWKQNGEIAGTEGREKRIEAIRIKLLGMEDYSVEYRAYVQDEGWQKWRHDGDVAGTEGENKRVEAIQIRIVKKEEKTLEPKVKYQAHIQDIGWQNEKIEGVLAGTEGQSKRIEAIKINLSDANPNARIKYKAHVQNYGWQNWKQNGELAGTTGQGKAIEAIQIKLEGMDKYTVEYQVHVQDNGWSAWMIDGETAGTTGQGKRIEAIRIRIVPKYYRSYKGIDVSEFNGEINWQSVKNSGVQFAMIRCAYRGYRTGRIVTDSQFENNIRNASAVGIKVGLYFFSQAVSISEAIEEANYAVNLAKKYNCVTYPIAIDTEVSGAENHDGRADGLNVALRTNVMVAFCNQIQNLGYAPMVYASRDWLYNNLEVNRLSNYETWLAHYTGNSSNKSDYKYAYSMWQYTSSGSVPGINGRVDMNIGYRKY